MAFALFSVFEASIVKKIHDLVPRDTVAHVLFRPHPMLDDDEFCITIPKTNATIKDLQEEMSELHQFKKHDWKPEEFNFYATCWSMGLQSLLDADDAIDDYGVLRLKLCQSLRWDSESDSPDSDSE